MPQRSHTGSRLRFVAGLSLHRKCPIAVNCCAWFTGVSRSPPWLASGWECWDRVIPEGEKVISLRQAHAFEQINVGWLTADRIHLPKDLDVSQGPCLLRIRFLKPIEGLVLVAKRGIIICNKAGIDIAPLLQLLAKLNGAAHSYVEATLRISTSCLIRYDKVFLIIGKCGCLLPFFQPQVILTQVPVRLSKSVVCGGVIWINVDCLFELVQSQIVLARVPVANGQISADCQIQGICGGLGIADDRFETSCGISGISAPLTRYAKSRNTKLNSRMSPHLN